MNYEKLYYNDNKNAALLIKTRVCMHHTMGRMHFKFPSKTSDTNHIHMKITYSGVEFKPFDTKIIYFMSIIFIINYYYY